MHAHTVNIDTQHNTVYCTLVTLVQILISEVNK